MAVFTQRTFIKHDDYMTPKYVWEHIERYIPKDKTIWEAFYGDGQSGTHLKELGCDVIHEPIDFFENDCGEVIITNPAFSIIPKVLDRLVNVIKKPFILIMPSSKMNTQYFRKLFAKNDDKIQIIVPKKRINFDKLVDGEQPAGFRSSCNFDCFYYCWKMDLDRDIIWLD